MAHDLFISYSSQDKPIADAVCAGLEADQIRCWIAPRDITPGTTWGEAIVNAISSSRVMVMIFSEHANASPQVLREVERAVAKGVILLPFRIEAVVPSGAMEFFLGTPHWLDALTPPLERHIRTLSQTVTAVLKSPTESGEPHSRAPQASLGKTRRVSPTEWEVALSRKDGWLATPITVSSAQYLEIEGIDHEATFKLRLESLGYTSPAVSSYSTGYVSEADWGKHRHKTQKSIWKTVPAGWSDRLKLALMGQESANAVRLRVRIIDF